MPNHPSHVLYTNENCKELHTENRMCPVCECGLSVCKVCGTYEGGLDEPCEGLAQSQLENDRLMASMDT